MQAKTVSPQFDPSELAEEFGTPLYVIDLDVLESNFRRMSQALLTVAKDFKIFYAVKANPLLAVLRRVATLGGGAEVVSLGEMEAARRAGFSPEDVIFNGPGKSEQEIAAAVEWGVASVNVESLSELELLVEICKRTSVKANVGFRINPGVSARTHGYLQTGRRGSKFGLDMKSFKRALELAAESELNSPKCVHMHFGSQIGSASAFRAACRRLMQFVRSFEVALGRSPEVIDIGGGLGLDYSTGKPYIEPEVWAGAVIGPLLSSRGWPPSAKLALEPGRSLVAQAGALVMKVLHVKETGETRWLIADSGMNDFLRTALYSSKHRIVNASRSSVTRERYFVGGPICESGDVFGEYYLPRTDQGDLLVLLEAGAYGSCMSSNYNGQPRPATVAVSRGSASLCERRESLDDMFARQVIA